MKKPILFALFFLLPSVSSAEIHQCNGVWTSRPCGEAPGERRSAQDPEAKLRREKKDIVNRAELRLLKDREEAGADVNITSIVRPLYSFCERPEVSVESCREAVDKKRTARRREDRRREVQESRRGTRSR